jgi:hypothetical protein
MTTALTYEDLKGGWNVFLKTAATTSTNVSFTVSTMSNKHQITWKPTTATPSSGIVTFRVVPAGLTESSANEIVSTTINLTSGLRKATISGVYKRIRGVINKTSDIKFQQYYSGWRE